MKPFGAGERTPVKPVFGVRGKKANRSWRTLWRLAWRDSWHYLEIGPGVEPGKLYELRTTFRWDGQSLWVDEVSLTSKEGAK